MQAYSELNTAVFRVMWSHISEQRIARLRAALHIHIRPLVAAAASSKDLFVSLLKTTDRTVVFHSINALPFHGTAQLYQMVSNQEMQMNE